MSQDIRDWVPASCELLAVGEPTHGEPAFPRLRNELFVQLAEHGFRSIALETDRVAALAVNDFVQHGAGTLDGVMSGGFSHGFGELAANRELVAWMREYNRERPVPDRLTFHGFDTPVEMTSAPSPRRCLEHARDYLGLDVDLTGLAGADELWSCPEAVMDPARSIGATAEADRLWSLADDMLTSLYTRAPELIARTSRAEWLSSETQLTTGIGLLRYHRQAAQHLEQGARISSLLAIRDALMAQNLLAIRAAEAHRGATLVFAQNLHLQRNRSSWRLADMDLGWFSAGAIVGSLLGERYTVVPGSLGRSMVRGVGEPEPDTYEGFLQGRVATWGLSAVAPLASATSLRTRTDLTPEQGYFPLDRATIDMADAILHVNGMHTTTPTASEPSAGTADTET